MHIGKNVAYIDLSLQYSAMVSQNRDDLPSAKSSYWAALFSSSGKVAQGRLDRKVIIGEEGFVRIDSVLGNLIEAPETIVQDQAAVVLRNINGSQKHIDG
jgi:hypothetical protein